MNNYENQRLHKFNFKWLVDALILVFLPVLSAGYVIFGRFFIKNKASVNVFLCFTTIESCCFDPLIVLDEKKIMC